MGGFITNLSISLLTLLACFLGPVWLFTQNTSYLFFSLFYFFYSHWFSSGIIILSDRKCLATLTTPTDWRHRILRPFSAERRSWCQDVQIYGESSYAINTSTSIKRRDGNFFMEIGILLSKFSVTWVTIVRSEETNRNGIVSCWCLNVLHNNWHM